MAKKGINWATELAFLLILLLFLSTKAWAFPQVPQTATESISPEKPILNETSLEPSVSPSLPILLAETPSYVSPKLKMEEVLERIAQDPYSDEQIASTYHPEGCLEFVQAIYNKAGLEISEVLKRSIQVSQPEDGDLIKITNSVYYGLPHWGIYYQGLVYHNWSSFRSDPYSYFIQRYALPSSPITVYHPVLKNPESLTSLFR